MDSQMVAKAIGRKLLVTPIEFPNVQLAVGINADVMSEIPQIDFLKTVAPKITPIDSDTTKNAGEIMQRVLKSIGGGV